MVGQRHFEIDQRRKSFSRNANGVRVRCSFFDGPLRYVGTRWKRARAPCATFLSKQSTRIEQRAGALFQSAFSL